MTRIFVTGGSVGTIAEIVQRLKNFNPQHLIRCHEKDMPANRVIGELKAADLIIFVGVDRYHKPCDEDYIPTGELAFQIGICANSGLNYIFL